jgi:predicted Zn-ribbon and HTH transcriptional regulator
MTRPAGGVPERRTTIREAIRHVLADGFATAREISGRVGVSEKDVAGHLEHLQRSLKAAGERLEIEPAKCLACGFVFKDRSRLTTPSRCPRCKDEGITPPRFHAKPARGAAAD